MRKVLNRPRVAVPLLVGLVSMALLVGTSTRALADPPTSYPSVAQTVDHGSGEVARVAPFAESRFSQSLIPPCTSPNVYDVHSVSSQQFDDKWSTTDGVLTGAGTFLDQTSQPGEYWHGTPTVSGDPTYQGGFTDRRSWETTGGAFKLDDSGALEEADNLRDYSLDLTLTTAAGLNAFLHLRWSDMPGFDIAQSAPTEFSTSCDGLTVSAAQRFVAAKGHRF